MNRLDHSRSPRRGTEDAPARIVVLASGSGTLFQALLDAAKDDYPARIAALVTDRECTAEQRAREHGVPVERIMPADHATREAWNSALAAAVHQHSPDLVVTAGFMRILGESFLRACNTRIVNSHPALLPSFPGAHAVRDALAHGVRITGTTVHLVDDGVDTGPILAQEAVPVMPGEAEPELHERIKEVERRLLIEVVADVVTRGVVIDGRKAMIP
ncbi:phosphoribosylglycinamide formyltransferase [Hoyosella sp. G463]|uniref:Phosphoribosylglycinamide formyltransferase n=1 Tax=Lolliginicoccus lacisalsi TaxID=2742202 RepID=A0A927JC08_9ACTN|nr:phosphoribosylglycinamide formyltransferase [Lolliginicoccus lacisalsi]MBD8506085.1 phosphoribosylglycinamide formyltransferase [Lolliginicoccus lacisalsi]